mmetsp:Transcript_17141/g.49714  ORF Transcript_17141/g.49714 Transcript_17141/m.49714 type:complete len:286 (+) Transcript_17141:374-1231(+)
MCARATGRRQARNRLSLPVPSHPASRFPWLRTPPAPRSRTGAERPGSLPRRASCRPAPEPRPPRARACSLGRLPNALRDPGRPRGSPVREGEGQALLAEAHVGKILHVQIRIRGQLLQRRQHRLLGRTPLEIERLVQPPEAPRDRDAQVGRVGAAILVGDLLRELGEAVGGQVAGAALHAVHQGESQAVRLAARLVRGCPQTDQGGHHVLVRPLPKGAAVLRILARPLGHARHCRHPHQRAGVYERRPHDRREVVAVKVHAQGDELGGAHHLRGDEAEAPAPLGV